jgi:hypothetical protein
MEAMTNISEDRIKELRGLLGHLDRHPDRAWLNSEDRSDLLSILDDYAKVKAENEELKKNEEAAYSCMMKELRRAEKAEDKLAEVTKLWSTAERDATHLYARMMKAEAQLAKVCERNRLMDDNFGSLLEKNIKLEEELAKQAPLVNALLRIANEAFPLEVTEKCMRSVARAALALREGAKK